MKKHLNIGIFTHDFYPFIGGQGRYVYEFYNQNLKYKKINLLVFSPSTNNLQGHIQIFSETANSKLKNIEFSWKLNFKIDELVIKYNLDIVHVQGGPGGVFLIKKTKVPKIYTSHHTYWQQSKYINEQRWKYIFYLIEKRCFQNSDKIICDCDSTKKVLINYYNIDNKKIITIPIGIDLTKFKPSKVPEEQRKELLYLGRIDKRKGVDFLVRTMKIVNKINPKIRLNIVGEGKDLANLEKFSKENNLNIKFHGFISDTDLNKIYDVVAIQIIPSIFEGFGLSVLEGMARGIGIIATNVDGIRDIIKNNTTGILTNYNDKESLAESILNLIIDKTLKQKILSNTFRCITKYNWKNIYLSSIKQYENSIKY